MAENCLKFSSSRPLAYTRLVQDRSCKTRSFSSATIIPSVGSEHQSDIPSPGVLSRLNVFGPWRDEPKTEIEREQKLAKKAQEAQRQEGKEEEQKKKRATQRFTHIPSLTEIDAVLPMIKASTRVMAAREQILGQALTPPYLITVVGTAVDTRAVAMAVIMA